MMKQNVKIYADQIEDEALKQIETIAGLEAFKNEKIAIMPDVHAGKGCVIGFTASYSDSIIPNLVGVDIGCGMLAANVGKADIDFKHLDALAVQNIPMGFGKNEVPVDAVFDYNALYCCHEIGEKAIDNAVHSICSLGGGNHFISCEVASNGDQWIIVHSGSRGFGMAVANYWQGIAKKMHPEMHPDLASLEGDALDGYLNDVDLAAKWASINRKCMMSKLLKLGGLQAIEEFETIHNYVDVEHSIVRKGSIAAYAGQKVLIPLNMLDGSLICMGKGNEDWNCSAPHGAGRKMSRGQAKKLISMEDYKESMKDIFTSSVCENTLDEAPEAYKNADSIKHLIDGETVDVLEHIHPVWNLKAH